MIGATDTTASVPKEPGNFNELYIWTISSIGALGGLLFGYDWVVIGGAKPFYEKFFNLTQPSVQGWAMSCALVGCLIGALASGRLSDRYGRKYLLMSAAFLFAISSAGTALASSFSLFVTWRILGGSCHWTGIQSLTDVHRRSRAGPIRAANWFRSTNSPS